MLQPPFRMIDSLEAPEADAPPPGGRTRLSQLDTHFHCSVIGTCLTTSDLRKLMARFIDAQGASDLDIHHEAVRLATQGGVVTKALQKALDHRHAATVQRFSKIQDADELGGQWDEALRQGEVPGAYWAALTHRKSSAALRQKVFGDVHMLSHLVGAANRADIRRLVALERENVELRERLDRHQLRSQELVDEKDRKIADLELEAIDAASKAVSCGLDEALQARVDQAEDAASLIALQTERRERAEQSALAAASEVDRLTQELEHLRAHALELNRELGATEAQLRAMSDDGAAANTELQQQLRGRRILYVGGRPSSAPAIRDLVLRHGGEIQRHGGGLEDRKGLLASAVAWAEVVVFPVDCIDHDSALNLKRLCARQQVRYIPLRGAGIGCFAAAFSSPSAEAAADGMSGPSGTPICLRHG